jgi:hypothetical protein
MSSVGHYHMWIYFYLIGILGSSTFNFHLVNRMLITCETSIGAFLHLTLL